MTDRERIEQSIKGLTLKLEGKDQILKLLNLLEYDEVPFYGYSYADEVSKRIGIVRKALSK